MRAECPSLDGRTIDMVDFSTRTSATYMQHMLHGAAKHPRFTGASLSQLSPSIDDKPGTRPGTRHLVSRSQFRTLSSNLECLPPRRQRHSTPSHLSRPVQYLPPRFRSTFLVPLSLALALRQCRSATTTVLLASGPRLDLPCCRPSVLVLGLLDTVLGPRPGFLRRLLLLNA